MIVGILSMSLSNEGCRPIQKVQLINKVVAHKTMLPYISFRKNSISTFEEYLKVLSH